MTRRPRRNRHSQSIRLMVQETRLSREQFIYPLFVQDGRSVKLALESLPGVYRFSPDTILSEIESCMSLGLTNFMLFPAVDDSLKDKVGSYGYADDNFYLKCATEIKKRFPECALISDVAMDPYSSDGHDGLIVGGRVDNDQTLPILSRMAVAQAQAGFDILGPSDMMDGRVAHMRDALDDAGYTDTAIMSYTAKYASAFYGPFRDALDSAPKLSDDIPMDKKSYQMNPANKREALIEAELDTFEGADFLMVKPAIHYLDVIQSLKASFDLPIVAYHVSGECAMLSAACQRGWLDYDQAMPETLLSIARAGADVIITYFAKDYCQKYS